MEQKWAARQGKQENLPMLKSLHEDPERGLRRISFHQMLNLRENSIHIRMHTQLQLENQQLLSKNISPRTHTLNCEKLRRWVLSQYGNLKKTNDRMEKKLKSALELIGASEKSCLAKPKQTPPTEKLRLSLFPQRGAEGHI